MWIILLLDISQQHRDRKPDMRNKELRTFYIRLEKGTATHLNRGAVLHARKRDVRICPAVV